MGPSDPRGPPLRQTGTQPDKSLNAIHDLADLQKYQGGPECET